MANTAPPSSPTPPTPAVVPFADAPLSDKELPNFLSRAAARASRNKWKDKTGPSSHNSPGFKPSNKQSRQVAKMRICGLSPREIAAVLDIEKSLLEFYYGYEIKTAKLRTNVSVAKVALDMALDGQHENMTKFWLKTQAGWKETDVHEHEGLDVQADEAKAARRKLLDGDE